MQNSFPFLLFPCFTDRKKKKEEGEGKGRAKEQGEGLLGSFRHLLGFSENTLWGREYEAGNGSVSGPTRDWGRSQSKVPEFRLLPSVRSRLPLAVEAKIQNFPPAPRCCLASWVTFRTAVWVSQVLSGGLRVQNSSVMLYYSAKLPGLLPPCFPKSEQFCFFLFLVWGSE